MSKIQKFVPFFRFDENDMWRVWNYMLYQLEKDMDPMYVRLPKGSRNSLDHHFFLTTCVLGKYPSLHDSGKTDNHLSTNDNSWVTSQVELVN